MLAAAFILAGCQSSIEPLEPAAIGPPWALPVTQVPGEAPVVATTAPTTGPASAASNSSNWWVNPDNSIVQSIAPETYDHIWKQSLSLFEDMGYHVNWQDYRLGVITTDPRIGPEILEFFRPDATDAESLMDSTLNTYRRSIRLTITPGTKAESWQVSVEVLVEKRVNPLGGPSNATHTASAHFGASALPLENGYAPGQVNTQYWITAGHDPKLEKKIMDELFQTL